jgi:polyphosphate kinase
VPIDLVVRDSCRIRPGIVGLSDTIRVVSIVGRFLEHSRIYYFRNGGDEEYFIGSADCMKRNLESRVEVLAPVEAPELQRELRYLLDAALADTCDAWEMNGDGSYTRIRPPEGEEPRSAQQLLIERAVKQHRQATRLKRRGLRSTPRRSRS